MSRVGASSHGESRMRMLRLVRRGDRDDARELTVSLRLEGASATAVHTGVGSGAVPGETLKTLVHQVARSHGAEEIETFGLALCRRVFDVHPHVARVRAEVIEHPWSRLDAAGKPQGQTFVLGAPEQRTAAVTSNGTQRSVVSGIEQLVLMRTAGLLPRGLRARPDDGSADAVQSLLVGSLSARWTYSNPDVTFGSYRQGVRAAITETFAVHARQSLQQTLYAIADVALASYQEILDITLTMHERPYRPADLFHADLAAADELFVAADAPLGIVEVTIERDR